MILTNTKDCVDCNNKGCKRIFMVGAGFASKCSKCMTFKVFDKDGVHDVNDLSLLGYPDITEW